MADNTLIASCNLPGLIDSSEGVLSTQSQAGSFVESKATSSKDFTFEKYVSR